jgi:hypothetical protein
MKIPSLALATLLIASACGGAKEENARAAAAPMRTRHTLPTKCSRRREVHRCEFISSPD